jgi:LPS-assembly protein
VLGAFSTLSLLSALILAVTQIPAQAQAGVPQSSGRQNAAKAPAPPPPASIPEGQWEADATHEETIGHLKLLRGNAFVENNRMLFQADEMDWDDETGDLHASGHVHVHNFEGKEDLWCDRLEYNTDKGTGKFYNVRGQTVPRIITRPGVLTGTSPFYFEGEWAERIDERYILHNGWVTNCKLPRPWWRLKGPRFVIVPDEKALAYSSVFRLKGVPLFFTPYFYHSLQKQPRKSGFLMPNITNSSQGGIAPGVGYYWAPNESYDVTYRFVDYTSRGYAHHLDLRGKPAAHTGFYVILYGVQDRGSGPKPVVTYPGLSAYANGESNLGRGWTARVDANYVSSLNFRQQWSQSFNEITGSEISSTAVLNKNWGGYTLDSVFSRQQNFQSAEIQSLDPQTGEYVYTPNKVTIRKLPELEFSGRDRPFYRRLPAWFSFESSAGLLSRDYPIFDPTQTFIVNRFQTARLTNRENLAPRLTGAFRLWQVHFVPSLAIHETFYTEGQSVENGFYQPTGTNIVRSARDFSLDVIFPSLARVYDWKTKFSDKVKHVIEPRATYRYVTGVGSDFNSFIRFDQIDLLSNTNELDLSLANRLYAKRGNSVQEIFSWTLMQARYFDPTFGGALIPGQRNVFDATAQVSPFAFLASPRAASPVASALRISPLTGLGVRWQVDYDPRTHGIVDSALGLDFRWNRYFLTASNGQVRLDPLLKTPSANQYRLRAGYGDANRRGVSAFLDGWYDYSQSVLISSMAQVTYNTDCCGFSVQYVRQHFGNRDETRTQFSFSVANVGSFGTLKKQDRMF